MAEVLFHPRFIEQVENRLSTTRAELERHRAAALDALDLALAVPEDHADRRRVEAFGRFLQMWVRDYWSAMAEFHRFDPSDPPSLDAADKLVRKLTDLGSAIKEASRDIGRFKSEAERVGVFQLTRRP